MSESRRPHKMGGISLAVVAAIFFGLASSSFAAKTGARKVIDLNGEWEVEQGGMDSAPGQFGHRVPVPGLADMAEPAFAEVGKRSEKREAFWYRRTFKVKGEIPEFAILKIQKARYGTKVWLNGKVVGEHLPCFTPALVDVKRMLKGDGEENELIIRLGADRESIPEGQPGGWDFEKYKYIPGIYDSVELILTGRPYIANVQTVPDISTGKVRVVTEIQWPDKSGPGSVTYQVVEAKTGKSVGSLEVSDVPFSSDQTTKLDVVIPIEDCRLWSPEDPFLYELKVDTGGDEVKVRFGMRSFRFDPESRRAILNGKPYYMRGTNVCVYRFFEDDARGDKPWDRKWVRQLHRKFKTMHWNSIRYCIGFPPELWYEIADEEGFLIQDEFPIWLLDKAPEDPKAEKIIPEYIEWMRERWNHACVVIWDGQNESVTRETGKAIGAVRRLDLSNRPWENGWAEPQNPTDFVEAHPYLFSKGWQGKESFRLKDMAKVSGMPYLHDAQKTLGVPIVINEYGWLWLTRDGEPTCLTDNVYKSLLGPDSTTEQRRELYAKYLAALTEFWRAHRECAGVLHFCGLTYSRPGDKPRPEGGATSDHFVDLEKLKFEPNFENCVRDAFSPVGIMVDFWDEQVARSAERQIKVFVINDLYEDRQETVELRIVRGKKVVSNQSKPCTVASLGREILTFDQIFPAEIGRYRLEAQLISKAGKGATSFREFQIAAGKE
ncbi:MAG TPA: glycoside hydrolase family 2 TIM barrel-domain containing protein [Sedimentisphaerales bacterium]|nr:glycoside hydrolase family 2 TIM barrel-domain containing protein [Sedimentisphaerales bacterium]